MPTNRILGWTNEDTKDRQIADLTGWWYEETVRGRMLQRNSFGCLQPIPLTVNQMIELEEQNRLAKERIEQIERGKCRGK